MNKYYYIFSTCVFVKGVRRGIVYDLQREDYEYVPNTLIELFELNNGSILKEVYKNFESSEDQEIINEYVELLIEKEFIFLSDFKLDIETLPSLLTDFKSPHKISNLIIDISTDNIKHRDKIIKETEKLGCGSILLRIIEKENFKYLKEYIEGLSFSSCRSIVIQLNDFEDAFEEIQDLCNLNPRIINVVFFNCIKKLSGFDNENNFYWSKVKPTLLYDSSHIVYHTNFNVNIALYTESLNFNPYYNRKVYIDMKGNIRNSPEVLEIFGNVSQNLIEEVIEEEKFNYLWSINKDSLNVCKVCEYRYMCVDARVPKFNNNLNTYLFNRECNYNPYTNQWKDAKEISEY